MNYKEFLDNVPNYILLDNNSQVKIGKGNFYPHPNMFFMDYRRIDFDPKNAEEYLLFSYNSGGYTGGNCYGDDSRYESSGEKISYDELDTLLEKVCPDISFLKYKAIIRLLSNKDKVTESEYYGNTNDYIYQTLPLRKLYNELYN